MAHLLGILTALPWVMIGILICFLGAIARFYQIKYAELYRNTPQQRTYYLLYLVPLLLYIMSSLRYALRGDFAGDLLSDISLLIGGAALAALAHRLQHLMTGGRR